MTTDDFVHALSTISLNGVFNPYRDRCRIYDRADAPYVRRANLRASLEAAIDTQVRPIWIGRDLGYRGGRRTGLPLTDEIHLPALSQAFGGVPLSRATIGPPVAERTAAIVWQVLARIGQPVFLWNIFPLHPFVPDDPLSNRRHTRKERQACQGLLLALLDMLRPDQIIAIGRDAHSALAEIGLPCHSVRHPSYGGQTAFIDGICELYGLGPKPEHDSALPL
jgi:uracil DNA glycosylase superfamily protein